MVADSSNISWSRIRSQRLNPGMHIIPYREERYTDDFDRHISCHFRRYPEHIYQIPFPFESDSSETLCTEGLRDIDKNLFQLRKSLSIRRVVKISHHRNTGTAGSIDRIWLRMCPTKTSAYRFDDLKVSNSSAGDRIDWSKNASTFTLGSQIIFE